MPFIGALIATDAVSNEVSILDIIEAGITADFSSCYDFKVKGVCVWIKCTIFGCKTKSTVYIEHFTPDGIVSVYQDFDNSPFNWGGTVSSLFGDLYGGTTGKEVNSDRNQKKQYTYRHADVYGSPAAQATTSFLSEMGLSCEAGSTAFQPYFVSASNPVFWYTGFIDSLSNLGDMNRWVGERKDGQTRQLNSELWGNLFPRTGININLDHYKSSGVIAQRAIDMVFNGGFLMYSKEFDGRKGSYYIPSEKVEEWNTKEGKWQMLYPKKEKQCHVLGQPNRKKNESTGDGWQDRRSENGSYAWHYWRQYECCQKPKGYSLLFKVAG